MRVTELLDDTDQSFFRQPPTSKFMSTSYGKNDGSDGALADSTSFPEEEEKGFTYVVRPSGIKTTVILSRHKLDYLMGIMGGCIIFWYFIFAWIGKCYNKYRVQKKVTVKLYDEEPDGCCTSCCFVCKIPACCVCHCVDPDENVKRINSVNNVVTNNLNPVELVKSIDNCYRLSSSFQHSIEARNASLVYFK